MPFESDKQKRWMYANEPEMAKKWSAKENEETFNGAVSDVLKRVDDKITVEGIGVYDYESLKANVKEKVNDLLERVEAGAHTGLGKNQFNVLAAMWQALANYESSKD